MLFRAADESVAARHRVLAATSVSYLIVMLDTSIVNVALERIAGELGIAIAGLQWLVSAYTLAFASLLLTGGTLGDQWGPRRVYGAGLALFAGASTLCGLAATLPGLVVARALQGAGAALLVPSSLKLINQACPEPAVRARAIGIWIGCGGVAMAAGPLVGGALIHAFGWRSIFFVNLPIGLLGLALLSRVPPDAASIGGARLDLPGQVSAAAALGGLIAVLIEGRPLGWTSPAISCGMAATAAAWICFLAVEARALRPMLPLSLFRNGIFTGSTVASTASAFVFYGLLFVTSLYFQEVRGYSPFQAGGALVPLTAMVAVGSLLSNRLVMRLGVRWAVCAAFGAYGIGALAFWSFGPASPYLWAIPPLLLIGLAAGVISPAATAPALGAVEHRRTGVAGAVLNAGRQAGAAIGVAIFGSLVAAFPSFETGLHAALATAAAASFIAGLVWWRALRS
ncbi:MFS transporter [Aliidongia dinghuensis]|uniref:MFS transporter n=1 Tax=Aliidongia dinghuensis TaxID=1867774 RepID=A0A8J2YZK4_9PROT|nr:MFS transporter [Aliidongia dinghuensis]